MIRNFLDLLAFSSILPLGRNRTIEGAAKSAFLYPLIGLIIGLISASIVYLLSYIPSRIFFSILSVFFILLLEGFHHIDGAVDMGDALFVRDKSRRAEIMKDRFIGTGSILSGFFTVFLLIAAFYEIKSFERIAIFQYVLLAEFLSRTCACFLLRLGKPLNKGMGLLFIREMKPSKFNFSLILAFVISMLFGIKGILSFLVLVLFSFIYLLFVKKEFGFMNGDLIGSGIEFSRIAILVFLIFSRWIL